jgi:hypothetical protein
MELVSYGWVGKGLDPGEFGQDFIEGGNLDMVGVDVGNQEGVDLV